MKRLFYLLLILTIFLPEVFSQTEKCAIDELTEKFNLQHPEHRSELARLSDQITDFQSNIASSRNNLVLKIPVVVHVIHNGNPIGFATNLSETRIFSQIQILNEDFRRLNSDAVETPAEFQSRAADAEIEFVLATIDPDGNPTNGITRHVYNNISNREFIESTIKPITKWDPSNYLNIWTVDMPDGSILGYSYLPTASIVGSNLDGVVVHFQKFGYISASNRGRTCTHEVGHYLGLSHIWGSNNQQGNPIGCGSDDGVGDTPDASGPHYSCPMNAPTSCGTNDMSMNYMDYTDDHCMNLFTQGQVDVMRGVLNTLRVELPVIENSNTGCFNLEVTDFNMGFEAFELMENWVIENTNGDNRTWQATQNSTEFWGPQNGDGAAVYLWNNDGVTPANDYLFTPCFDIKQGNSYKISFAYACARDESQVFPERLEVGFSETQNSSDFDVINDTWVFDPVTNAFPDYRVVDFTFDATGTSTVSLGFHVFSEADQFAMLVDDVRIEDLGQTTAIEQIESETLNFKMYPNPAKDILNIELSKRVTQNIEFLKIHDYLGHEIYNQKAIKENAVQLDLQNYEKGIYFVSLFVGGEAFTQRLIILE